MRVLCNRNDYTIEMDVKTKFHFSFFWMLKLNFNFFLKKENSVVTSILTVTSGDVCRSIRNVKQKSKYFFQQCVCS